MVRAYWEEIIISYWIIQYCELLWFNCFFFPSQVSYWPSINLTEFCTIRGIINLQIFEVYEAV